MMDDMDMGGAATPEIETTAETAAEAKAAEFLAGFAQFREELSGEIARIGTRVEALSARAQQQANHEAARPALSAKAEVAQPHAKAFGAYVRGGDEHALRSIALEGKGLNTGLPDQGGFLVDPRTSAAIEAQLRGAGSLRSIARVVQVEATAYDVLIDQNDLDAAWQAETTAVSESSPTVARISIALHELSASPQASQRLLDDSAFDVEMWLAERIADKFGRAETAAFVDGDGLDKPSGFLRKPALPNVSWLWGTLGYVTTGVLGGFDLNDPGDAIVDLVYSLGAAYRQNGTFVMNSRTAGEVRKMKDNQGRFLWVESVAEASPARLLGYPVVILEDMPDIDDDSLAIAFGDFGRGYTVAERPDTRILRDPYSAKPNVVFYATKRVGGDVSDFAAIKLLKFGVA
ncbi:MAG: phage major capsid protein [Pseudomonadota bacterium]